MTHRSWDKAIDKWATAASIQIRQTFSAGGKQQHESTPGSHVSASAICASVFRPYTSRVLKNRLAAACATGRSVNLLKNRKLDGANLWRTSTGMSVADRNPIQRGSERRVDFFLAADEIPA
jgi:hypothetical protein